MAWPRTLLLRAPCPCLPPPEGPDSTGLAPLRALDCTLPSAPQALPILLDALPSPPAPRAGGLEREEPAQMAAPPGRCPQPPTLSLQTMDHFLLGQILVGFKLSIRSVFCHKCLLNDYGHLLDLSPVLASSQGLVQAHHRSPDTGHTLLTASLPWPQGPRPDCGHSKLPHRSHRVLAPPPLPAQPVLPAVSSHRAWPPGPFCTHHHPPPTPQHALSSPCILAESCLSPGAQLPPGGPQDACLVSLGKPGHRMEGRQALA